MILQWITPDPSGGRPRSNWWWIWSVSFGCNAMVGHVKFWTLWNKKKKSRNGNMGLGQIMSKISLSRHPLQPQQAHGCWKWWLEVPILSRKHVESEDSHSKDRPWQACSRQLNKHEAHKPSLSFWTTADHFALEDMPRRRCYSPWLDPLTSPQLNLAFRGLMARGCCNWFSRNDGESPVIWKRMEGW